MRQASYRRGIDCIAFNDEPSIVQWEEMIGMATVLLMSDLFGVPQEKVTKDIVKLREKDKKIQ